MKRCPECHSISPDDEVTCGACGASIAEAPFETMDEIDQEQMADQKKEEIMERKSFSRLKRRMIITATIITLAGVSAIVLGIYLIGNGNTEYGFIALIAGIAILFVFLGLDPVGVRRYGATFGVRRSR